MRSFVFAMAVSVLLATGLAPNALAVGVYVAGKEDCKCSPLVAAGIIPDPLNTLSAMPIWQTVTAVAERIAAGVQALLNQSGAGPTLAAMAPEESPVVQAEEKPLAKPKKATKAKKVKRPPTAR